MVKETLSKRKILIVIVTEIYTHGFTVAKDA